MVKTHHWCHTYAHASPPCPSPAYRLTTTLRAAAPSGCCGLMFDWTVHSLPGACSIPPASFLLPWRKGQNRSCHFKERTSLKDNACLLPPPQPATSHYATCTITCSAFDNSSWPFRLLPRALWTVVFMRQCLWFTQPSVAGLQQA